jgi:hypothetical protein
MPEIPSDPHQQDWHPADALFPEPTPIEPETQAKSWPDPGERREINGALCEWRLKSGNLSVRDYFVRTPDNLGAPGHDSRTSLTDPAYAARLNLDEPIGRLVVLNNAELIKVLPDQPMGEWVAVP